MPNYVKRLQAYGIYDRFNIVHSFQPGINILFGKNGAGKTTLLHILANILNGSYERFAFLVFDSIRVQFDDATEVNIYRKGNNKSAVIQVEQTDFPQIEFPIEEAVRYTLQRRDETRVRQLPLFEDEIEQLRKRESPMKAAYFPAFRTMIEAWASVQEDRPASISRRVQELTEADFFRLEQEVLRGGGRQRATLLARQLFGQFVPAITYPSPLEIEVRLTEEFSQAERKIGYTNQELLSQAFLDIFAVLSENSGRIGEKPEVILEQIRALFGKLDTSSFGAESMVDEEFYTKLRSQVESFKFYGSESLEGVAVSILDVYRKSLSKRAVVQESSFQEIRRYLQAVNEFLEGKSLYIRRVDGALHKSALQIRFDDESYSGFRALSSGERQIITMIYAASQMSAQKTVLIDEPEISLHIDWQRLLLKKMSEQLQGRQVIACTHSPVIGADYEDRLMELKLIPTKKTFQEDTSTDFSELESEEGLF